MGMLVRMSYENHTILYVKNPRNRTETKNLDYTIIIGARVLFLYGIKTGARFIASLHQERIRDWSQKKKCIYIETSVLQFCFMYKTNRILV